MVTRATDSGGPFRSFRLEAFVTAHRELTHVRIRVRGPGQSNEQPGASRTQRGTHRIALGCREAGQPRGWPPP